jgi:diphthamide biosynthesis enzyme Dph1/Dph2-like protein
LTKYLHSYSIPICFLPDLDHKNVLDHHIIATIKKFFKTVVSKNLLIIIDQFDVSTAVFEMLCVDEKFILKFANSSNECQNSMKLFDFYIPFDLSEFNDTSLIYIGPHEKLATDLGCIFYNHDSLRIDSRTFKLFECSISRELAKRCSLINSISSHDHIGIIVENPNVRMHVETAQYLQNICAANDMIADILYIGRLNEMKIGNFADIEFFIHLSCAGRPTFHFVKPIVSPLEFICAKFEVDFWSNQILRDYFIFLKFCEQHKMLFLQNNSYNNNLSGQLVVKNFFELSNQLLDSRKKYSYNGLEINSIDKEMKLHQGATGNSTAYDYEFKE